MSVLPPEVRALRALAFFSELTVDDLLRVTRIRRQRAFAAGATLVERGSDSGGLFVPPSGTASVDAGGAIHELAPGDFFGEIDLLGRKEGTGPDLFGEHAVLGRGRRSTTVTAVEPVEALVIETIFFEPFLLDNPSVAVAFPAGRSLAASAMSRRGSRVPNRASGYRRRHKLDEAHRLSRQLSLGVSVVKSNGGHDPACEHPWIPEGCLGGKSFGQEMGMSNPVIERLRLAMHRSPRRGLPDRLPPASPLDQPLRREVATARARLATPLAPGRRDIRQLLTPAA